jgi:hypothetical protein
MRGRRAAILATLGLGCVACIACEALVGISDRSESKAPDAGSHDSGVHVTPPAPDATADTDAADGPDAADDAPPSTASYACDKGGCNGDGGACTAEGTCYCVADTECKTGKCVAVAGKNDVACGSSCSGSGATDGFNCQIAACSSGTFGYAPSNFSPASYTPPSSATTDCNGTYSSTTHAFTSGGCGGQAPTIVRSAAQTSAGHAVDILVFQSLTIAGTSTLTLVGANPIILAVYGDATIHGVIDASASGSTPGAGADTCPAASNGVDAGTGDWEPGAGGAGQASAGGTGGSSTAAGEPAGAPQGSGTVPLTGGCAGGMPFVGSLGYTPTMGAGGGGIQISAAGRVDFSGGILKANASNGGNGESGRCNGIAQNGTGGAGGGSGGTILVEGASVVAGTTSAKGGTGGTGGAAPSPNGQSGGDGGAGGVAGAGGANGGAGVQKGSAPSGCSWGGYWSGGGGGGGAGGYVKTNQGPGACLCKADSECSTGHCANVSSQCSGTCTGTTATGTYDSVGCEILTTTVTP